MSDLIVTSPRLAEPPHLHRAVAEPRVAEPAADRPTAPPRGRWGEAVLALLALGLAWCADLALLRVGLDPVDEGYFAEQATRVAHGQVPYRDFDSLYTPGLVYVHAALLSVLHVSALTDVRITGLLARLVLAVGLYLLCRPMLRPALAVLPSLFVLVGLDRLPLTWEPHPGWPSAALTVVTAWAYTRLPTTGGVRRRLLLVGIGALAALVFAFKQNAGVLLGLALVVSTAWQGIDETRTGVTRTLRAVQIVLLLMLVAATAWLIRPHADPIVLAYFLVPLLAVGLTAIVPVRIASSGRGIGAWLRVLLWLGIGWSLVSLPWLIALLTALDWNIALLKGFIGLVNQDLLWFPPQGPSTGAWASLLGIAVGLLAVVRWKAQRLVCAGLVLVVLALAVSMVILTAEPAEPTLRAIVLAPGRAAEGVVLSLPIVCMLAGAALSLRPLPPRTAWWLGWMTVASAVTFLTEYPRVDDIHLTWSACLPLATGAVVLAHVSAGLTRRWRASRVGRGLLAVGLVLVPVAVTLLNLILRTDGLIAAHNSGTLGLRLAPTTVLAAPPAVRGMTVSADQASTLVAAAEFVTAQTTPGEPIFVYPTSPLIYVMADRPNPTRFAHLYPGAASPAEVDAIIATLDQTPVNVVVVCQSDMFWWGPPGDNAALEAFVANHYHEIAQFGDYRVLRRS